MRKTLIVFFALLLTSSLVFAKGKKMSDIKIAVVDWAAVIAQSPLAKEGDAAVAQLREREESRILEMAKQLQAEIDKSPADKKASLEETSRKQITEAIDKMTAQVTDLTTTYITKTVESVNASVRKIATKHNIDIVLNKQAGIVFNVDVMDITREVINDISAK